MVQFPRDAARVPGAQVSDSATDPRVALTERADALCRRLVEIEQAVAVEEWWLLGRALPEARLLAEVSSLLAVARGELENVLAQHFGRPSMRSDTTDQYNTLTAPSSDQTNDPVWLAGQREKAIHLLRLVASSLPPMMQYAQMLQAHAERLGFASGALDSLGIVADRLNEAYEALRQPPR